MIYFSIKNKSKHSTIESQCKFLEVSKNSYYNWIINYDIHLKNEARLLIEINWDSKGIYGSPRITAALKKNGVIVSQGKVQKRMKLLGIESIHTSKFPSRKSSLTTEEKILINNLILNLNITHPNQVWTTDITYINTKYDGTLYLISFIDQFSKKVVGWFLGRNQKTESIFIALNIAIKKRKPLPGLIIHSDKGSQFRSKSYRKLLAENHFLYSYTELYHSCDQNAAQESFHATLKKNGFLQDHYIIMKTLIKLFLNL